VGASVTDPGGSAPPRAGQDSPGELAPAEPPRTDGGCSRQSCLFTVVGPPDVTLADLASFRPAQPSLTWDLGETRGTVAVRMPAHRVALELLEETGPLAVSSANLTGHPAATTAAAALEMLGDRVEVYLDDGPSEGGVASTIVDATALVGGVDPVVRVLREGAIDRARLRSVLGDLLEPDPVPPAWEDRVEFGDGSEPADGAQ
jgi:hypothetical protein